MIDDIEALKSLRRSGTGDRASDFDSTLERILQCVARHMSVTRLTNTDFPFQTVGSGLRFMRSPYPVSGKELSQGIEYLTKLKVFQWTNPDRTLLERVQSEWAEGQSSEDRQRIFSLGRFCSYESIPGSSDTRRN